MATEKKIKLTGTRDRFCNEYIIDFNGTRSAIVAGFSEKTAYSQACRLLKNVEIRARIKELVDKRNKRTQIDQDYVLKGFEEVAERCTQRKPVMEFDRESKQMKQAEDINEDGESVGVYQFDSAGAVKAFENIGKHVGFYEKDNDQKTKFEVNVINSFSDGGDGTDGK